MSGQPSSTIPAGRRGRLAILCLALAFPVSGRGEPPARGQDAWLDSLGSATSIVIGSLVPRFGEDTAPGATPPARAPSAASPALRRGRPGPFDPRSIDPGDPGVAALIREWISLAEPPENALNGGRYRYNEWGAILGSGPGGTITGTPGKPDDVGARSSERYLWEARRQLDSVNHCTLEEYVLSRANGWAIGHCQGRYRARSRPEMPDITGMPVDLAVSSLAERGLRPAIETGKPAPTPALAGSVQSQSPAAGTSVRPGDPSKVIIFTKFVLVTTVPRLQGSTLGDAEARTRRAGLKLVVSVGTPAPGPDLSGRIQSQDPAPGARVAAGSSVAARVHSAHVKTSRVPRVMGLSLESAEARVEAAGLSPQVETGSPAPRPELAGRVESQTPAAGTVIRSGRAVGLRVHTAHVPLVRVPGLIDLSLGDARGRASGAGLELRDASGAQGGTAGMVVRQEPRPRAFVRSGSTITVWVHHEPPAEPLAPPDPPRFVPPPAESVPPQAPPPAMPESAGPTEPAPAVAPEAPSEPEPAVPPASGPEAVPEPPREPEPVPRPEPAGARPFHVALGIYMPRMDFLASAARPPGAANAGPEQARQNITRAIAAVDVSALTFQPAPGSALILAVSGAALSRYPRAMFEAGAELSGPATIRFRDTRSAMNLDVEGALFFKVERVLDSMQEVATAYPGATTHVRSGGTRSPLLLEVASADGRFPISWSDAKGMGSVQVGPLIKGWPDEMRRKFLEMMVRVLSQVDFNVLGSMKCFVATAVYGGHRTAPQLVPLRRFRDEVLLVSPAGRRVTRWYYTHGPALAERLARDGAAVRPRLRALLDRVSRALARADLDQPWIQDGAELAAGFLAPVLELLVLVGRALSASDRHHPLRCGSVGLS